VTAPEFHLYFPQMRVTMETLVEKAVAAEAAGFTGMAGMDHMAPPLAEEHDMLESLTTHAWLLAHTQHLVQAPLVLCDAFRHPAVLARQAVTLDRASGGRFELGIGWGSVEDDFTKYGVRPLEARARVARLGETLAVLRALWSGETVDFDGEWFQLAGARHVPTPLGRIPITVGGTGRRSLELVARYADWWNVPVHQLDRLDEMRAHAGDARISIQEMVAYVPTGADGDRIEELARRRFGYSSLLVGDRHALIDHYQARRDAGIERCYVWFTDFAPPATLAAFGAEVIDALR
jgi:alkanesulfonate monooxygenase SsuD/methylene tetrahydromethanopterin reductase-like flavin-dependent oxidoreductase (luciferase family)